MQLLNFAELLLIAQNAVNQPRDLFVAFVAVGLGLNIIYTVICNSERCFELATVQMIERNLGRNNAKFVLILLGSMCVVLGIYLAAQATIRKSVAQELEVDCRTDGICSLEPTQMIG